MDETVNRYTQELIDAIDAAVARDPGVQACRERARADGFELEVSLEAVISRRRPERAGGAGRGGVGPAFAPAEAHRSASMTSRRRTGDFSGPFASPWIRIENA